MKNSVIKKLMAYLLVGAMVVSTPIAASAAGSISDAYSETEDDGTAKPSSSGTQSGTSTNTTVISDNLLNVLGIELDTDSVDLEKGEKATVQARVVFSDYDASDEEMEWAVDAETKDLIENRLHWEIADTSVAKFPEGQSADYSKRVIEAKASGSTTVCAWFDMNLDGVLGAGDFSAYADINVTEYATAVVIKDVPTLYLKHTYNLNDYTYLTVDGKEVNASDANENVTYYLTGDAKDLKNLTISDAGVLTVKKLPASETKVVLYAVAEKCTSAGVELKFNEGVAATGIEIVDTASAYISNVNAKKSSATISLDPGAKDDKGAYKVSDTLQVKMTAGETDAASITDVVTWKSSNVKVADVVNTTSDEKNATASAVVDIKGVGSAKITATTTSGKKVTYTVKVTATATGIELTVADSMYTGQSKQAVATVITGDKQITNKLKATFAIEKVDGKANKNVKVDSKGVVKASNILDTLNTNEAMSATATLTASIKNTDIKESAKITINQANISGINVFNASTGYAAYTDNDKHNAKAAAAEKVYVGLGYGYTAVDSATGEDVTDMVQWASSSAKVATVDNAYLTPLAAGKANVKVSYVTLTKNAKTGKYSAKLVTKAIPVQVIQKATSLTLNKSEFVVAPGKKATVSINVKTQLPKGSADVITWKVLSADQDGKEFISESDIKVGTDKLHKSVKITIPATAQAGDVVKVGAYADGGAVAYAYIYVTNKTSSVVISNKADGTKDDIFTVGKTKNKTEMTAGTELTVYSRIVLADKTTATPGLAAANGKGIVNETVSYSVDSKGASVVKVSADGTITALKPGTAKVTAKTISGKKATLTVVVTGK